MADTTPYSVPREPGRWRAIGMAVAVHAALFVFLWIGIRWQSETPVAIEAEVWNMQAKDAAPRQSLPPEPKPEPERKPTPEPEPVRKPEPKPMEKTPVEKPDIALEQERKKKEKAKRDEEERLARLKKEQELAEQDKKEQAKKEKDKLALEKEKEKAALEKQKTELAKKEKAEAERKRQEALDKKLLEAMRAEEMKRIAGTTAGSGGTGTAAKSQGMRGDAGYAGKVAAKIKSNTAFSVPPDLTGNPEVEYDVQLFPDGSLRGAPRKVKSSGITAFDDAVRRAIELSAPYPADKSGAVPSAFSVKHRPKEL